MAISARSTGYSRRRRRRINSQHYFAKRCFATKCRQPTRNAQFSSERRTAKTVAPRQVKAVRAPRTPRCFAHAVAVILPCLPWGKEVLVRRRFYISAIRVIRGRKTVVRRGRRTPDRKILPVLWKNLPHSHFPCRVADVRFSGRQNHITYVRAIEYARLAGVSDRIGTRLASVVSQITGTSGL